MKYVLRCVALVTLAGCGVGDVTEPPVDVGGPMYAISDALHSGGTAGFYFLPPLVAAPNATGAFDADITSLDPRVTICDLALGENVDCGGTIPAAATFTRSSSPAITVDPAAGQYHVNWSTKAAGFVAAHTYRLHVVAGGAGSRRELGFLDVLLTASPGQAKQAGGGNTIVLNHGQTVPVKFRIETGIPGAMALRLDPITVRTGEGTTASATVLDLHGGPLAGVEVPWASSGVAVSIGAPTSTTGPAGVAVTTVTAGSTPGSATVTASAEGLSTQAALTVIPAVIDQADVLARMNDARHGMAVAAHGGLLYAIGGRTNYVGLKSTNEVYDPATDQWWYRTPMPTARSYPGAAVVDGMIYVISGHNGLGCCDLTAVVEAYDPATDTWTTKAPLPFPREQFATAVHNGIIYVFGGWTPGWAPFLASVEAYDPATNTWTPRAPMPAPRAGSAAATVNGKIYVVGGQVADVMQPTTLEYDPVADTWATKAAIPSPRHRLGAAVVNGIVYAVGGGGNGSAIEAYDPSTNTWSVKSNLNIPRWALGVAALGGAVYAVGGVKDILDVPQLERYRP